MNDVVERALRLKFVVSALSGKADDDWAGRMQ
jgi:hypothetical protein